MVKLKEMEIEIVKRNGDVCKINAVVLKEFGQYAEVLTKDARKRFGWCHSAVKLNGRKS